MGLRGLLLGAMAVGGWYSLTALPDDDWIMPSFVYTGGGGPPRHRSSGGRAHRRWRTLRSSGRR